jgi:hypothetical protein
VDASQATALDFTTSSAPNGALPGLVTNFNGGLTGSFAGQFCSGTCGSINDISSLVIGPTSITPFFTLTDGVVFSLTSINTIDRSVAGVLAFTGGGIFSGNIGGVAFDATPGNFVFSTQGGQSTTFSATTVALPEPGTWGMMLLGFGAIGFAMRRRRRTTALAQIA